MSWHRNPSFKEARKIQESLRSRVVEKGLRGPIRRIAGTDVAYLEGPGKANIVFATAVVYDPKTNEVLEVASARARTRFPYVSGYLSFREAPALLEALAKLSAPPDLILCDGQGRAHPRRCGLACHVGVLLDLPTIGCAKSRLIGEGAPPAAKRGSWSALEDGGDVIGAAVRTRSGVKPVFVSVGHRISLRAAIRWVLRLASSYRIPEPLRAAHREAQSLRDLALRDLAPIK